VGPTNGTQEPRLLEISKLGKTYRGARGPVEAIESVDLSVQRSEFVSIVGPSGCGKSTLLKLVAGLLKPSTGTVSLLGHPVRGPVSDLGMVFQQPTLLRWRTALANVLLPVELMGNSVQPHVERARALLEEVGLEGFEHHLPGQLSGGMQQRVALCRALVTRPSLLLMDEPFSSLDELTREALNDQLLDLWGHYRKTVVYVTHSVPEAVYLSDRVAVLSARPARLLNVVPVPLPRPRTAGDRYRPEFIETTRRIREQLRA
jgi:NitT/TauT family transport system ATP-binding protein